MAPTHPARRLHHRLEAIHAVTYFADESRAAAKDIGLKGFWMGYFGFRAAPLGPVGAGVVEAVFANFAPRRVRKAVPDAWAQATDEGRALHEHIESTTDELALRSLVAGLGRVEAVGDLAADLTPLARAVRASGVLAFPNPIGLPDD